MTRLLGEAERKRGVGRGEEERDELTSFRFPVKNIASSIQFRPAVS